VGDKIKKTTRKAGRKWRTRVLVWRLKERSKSAVNTWRGRWNVRGVVHPLASSTHRTLEGGTHLRIGMCRLPSFSSIRIKCSI